MKGRVKCERGMLYQKYSVALLPFLSTFPLVSLRGN